MGSMEPRIDWRVAANMILRTQKCTVKRYKPGCRVGEMYTDKLRGWADRKGITFGVPDSEKSALVVNPSSVTYACGNGEWVPVP